MRHSDEPLPSWYVATIWIRGSDEPVRRVRVSAGSLAEAEHELEAAYGRGNYRVHVRPYKAIIWTRDDEPGKRVIVHAHSLDEAQEELEAAYGKGHVFALRNEEDAEEPR